MAKYPFTAGNAMRGENRYDGNIQLYLQNINVHCAASVHFDL